MCEKSLENIWIYEINAVTLHPLSRQKMLLATAQEAEKVLKNFLKKVSKKFGGFKKMPYLCNRFRAKKMLLATAQEAKRFSKIF